MSGSRQICHLMLEDPWEVADPSRDLPEVRVRTASVRMRATESLSSREAAVSSATRKNGAPPDMFEVQISHHHRKEGSMKRRLLTFAAIAATLGAVVPASALALRSYDGDDYSEDYNSVSQVRICDNESDGNQAYAEYQRNGSGAVNRIYDGTGGEPGCSGTSTGPRIYRHQACEDVTAWPDHCDQGWVYP